MIAYTLSVLLGAFLFFGLPVLLLLLWQAHLRGLARVRRGRRG